MPLPRQIFAPAFRQKKLGWFLTALVGIMVYVATFATAAEATLSALSITWDKGIETRMTVEIPAVDDESAQPQSDRVQQAMAILQAMPELKSVKLIPDNETADLLKPWIDKPEVLKAIPIPTLIDIERRGDAQITPADIAAKLKSAVPDVRVDAHAKWLSSMQHLVRGLSLMAGLMILLTAVTLVIAVSLICRAIMATEHETVALLHVMGAEDGDIARHFQLHAKRLAAPAAWLGFLLAITSAGILLFFLHNATGTALQPLHWAALGAGTFLVPVLAIWIASISARISTLKLLHMMP